MPFAKASDGTRLHYTIHEPPGPDGPKAPAVVLLQGLGLSSSFWFQIPAELAARPGQAYRVITPDNRGTGRSDKPRGPYRMSMLADDVAAVLDHAGVGSALIAGISLGGMIAQHVALGHPGRVGGLVLLATTPGLPHGKLARPSALRALLSIPFATPGKPSPALLRLLLPQRHIARAAELFADWPGVMRDEPPVRHVFFAQLAAAVGHSTGFRLSRVRCPVVVVTGKDDILIPPGNSEVLARLLPNARLHVLPDVGHAIPVLDREVVGRALDELLQMAAGAAEAPRPGAQARAS